MDGAVRVWLVERGYDDRGLITLVYATPDGKRRLRREVSPALLDDVTAARAVDPDRLDPVADPETRDRYAAEAARMAERNDPDDPV